MSEQNEPKIEKKLTREEIIAELSIFLSKYHVIDTESEGEYADGFNDAMGNLDNLVKELEDKIPELKK